MKYNVEGCKVSRLYEVVDIHVGMRIFIHEEFTAVMLILSCRKLSLLAGSAYRSVFQVTAGVLEAAM